MFLSNKIAGFFDHQYLWKETIIVLDFLRRISYREKIGCKSTIVDWVLSCPVMPRLD